MKSEKILFQLFLTTLEMADFRIALDFKVLKILKMTHLSSITSSEKCLQWSPFILQFKLKNTEMKAKNKDSLK